MCVSFFSPLTPRVSLHRPCFRATVPVTDNNDNFTIDGRSQGNWLEERDIHCYLSIIVNWENTYCLSFIFSIQESQSLERSNINSFTEE